MNLQTHLQITLAKSKRKHNPKSVLIIRYPETPRIGLNQFGTP